MSLKNFVSTILLLLCTCAGQMNLGATALANIEDPSKPAQEPAIVDKGKNEKDEPVLSPECIEIAAITGIQALCKQLDDEQKNHSNQFNDMQKILHNQRIIYLHTKINLYLHTANLEITSVTGKLNSGLAELADRQASISDARARSLRRNNFVNLVSGGITKIGGYSTALANASPIPTNVLEVFDGGVQSSLSAMTMRQLKEEAALSKEKPAILGTFLNGSNASTKLFPESVWTYLAHKAPDSTSRLLTGAKTESRRKALIDYWIKEGRLKDSAAGARKNQPKRTRELSGLKLPMNDLDDTVSMMSDLKSVVAGMENSLMELSQVLKHSYQDDPEI
ncbi:MAG: hypothetical protein P4L53_12690 [Candidatus Obscuribacterales bacterium]|nr:hypothetical protein [Candidatus Obscuribacterales bacterium]